MSFNACKQRWSQTITRLRLRPYVTHEKITLLATKFPLSTGYYRECLPFTPMAQKSGQHTIMEQGLSKRESPPSHPSELYDVISQQGAKMLQLLFCFLFFMFLAV